MLAFSTEHRWIIPLQELPAAEVVTKGLSGLTPAGGTNLSTTLTTAAEALRKSKASLKHIILFTDGFTTQGVLDGLVDQAKKLADEGITVSVLATGEGDAQQLQGDRRRRSRPLLSGTRSRAGSADHDARGVSPSPATS